MRIVVYGRERYFKCRAGCAVNQPLELGECKVQGWHASGLRHLFLVCAASFRSIPVLQPTISASGGRCSLCALPQMSHLSRHPFVTTRSASVAWAILDQGLVPAAETVPIPFLPRIEHDLVRERICITGRDWRNVVFVSVHNADYLHCCLLQRTFHRSSYLLPFCPRTGFLVALLANKELDTDTHLLQSLAVQSLLRPAIPPRELLPHSLCQSSFSFCQKTAPRFVHELRHWGCLTK